MTTTEMTNVRQIREAKLFDSVEYSGQTAKHKYTVRAKKVNGVPVYRAEDMWKNVSFLAEDETNKIGDRMFERNTYLTKEEVMAVTKHEIDFVMWFGLVLNPYVEKNA